MSKDIIQLNEEVVKNELKELVRACLIFSTIFNIKRFLYFAVALSILLALLRIITMVVCKKPIGIFSFMKQKLFWLYTALILLIISIIVFLANN